MSTDYFNEIVKRSERKGYKQSEISMETHWIKPSEEVFERFLYGGNPRVRMTKPRFKGDKPEQIEWFGIDQNTELHKERKGKIGDKYFLPSRVHTKDLASKKISGPRHKKGGIENLIISSPPMFPEYSNLWDSVIMAKFASENFSKTITALGVAFDDQESDFTAKEIHEFVNLIADNQEQITYDKVRMLGKNIHEKIKFFGKGMEQMTYKEIRQRESDRESQEALLDKIRRFKSFYPQNRFLTESDVENICLKYGLMKGDLEMFAPEIPLYALEEIKNFKYLGDEDNLDSVGFDFSCINDEGFFGLSKYDVEADYDNRELKAKFTLKEVHVEGNSVIAFLGENLHLLFKREKIQEIESLGYPDSFSETITPEKLVITDGANSLYFDLEETMFKDLTLAPDSRRGRSLTNGFGQSFFFSSLTNGFGESFFFSSESDAFTAEMSFESWRFLEFIEGLLKDSKRLGNRDLRKFASKKAKGLLSPKILAPIDQFKNKSSFEDEQGYELRVTTRQNKPLQNFLDDPIVLFQVGVGEYLVGPMWGAEAEIEEAKSNSRN